MYTWEIPREKLVTLQDGLDLRLKYHLQFKKRKERCKVASFGEVTRKININKGKQGFVTQI